MWLFFVVVQSLIHVQFFANPWIAAHQASLSFAISLSLLKLMSIESVMPSNHLILCHSLLLLPSIFPSIRVFSIELALHIRRPKYWSICSSNEYSGLISFRIDWFDLAVQGTLKSLLQHHSLKVSILQCSAFFMAQLSHLYMTTGKTISLARQMFVSKVMSLLFNTLSRFIIVFLPRNERLLMLWLQSQNLHWFWSPRIWNMTVSTFPIFLPLSDSYSTNQMLCQSQNTQLWARVWGPVFMECIVWRRRKTWN